jgi:hypothetical protein
MADGSLLNDAALKLLDMERQARCLSEYLRRGDLELALWLATELRDELRHFGANLGIDRR